MNIPHRHGPINCVDWFRRFLLPFRFLLLLLKQICQMSSRSKCFLSKQKSELKRKLEIVPIILVTICCLWWLSREWVKQINEWISVSSFHNSQQNESQLHTHTHSSGRRVIQLKTDIRHFCFEEYLHYFKANKNNSILIEIS